MLTLGRKIGQEIVIEGIAVLTVVKQESKRVCLRITECTDRITGNPVRHENSEYTLGVDQQIRIGNHTTIKIVEARPSSTKIGIVAPPANRIHRGEHLSK